jgi:hypothetical protein
MNLMCYVVSCGLLEDDGTAAYTEETREQIADLFCVAVDAIYKRILYISKLSNDALADKVKNSNPSTNDASKSDLPQSSDAGTSTNSSPS